MITKGDGLTTIKLKDGVVGIGKLAKPKQYRDIRAIAKKLHEDFNIKVDRALAAEIEEKDNQNNPIWD